MVKLPAAILCMSVLCGCVSEPLWVSEPPKALCFSRAEKSCIGDLIARSVESERPGNERDDSLQVTRALMAGAGIQEPATLSALRSQSELVMCLRPDADFVSAGAAINSAREKRFTTALDSAEKVQDPEARLLAFKHIAALAARSDDEKAIARSLNTLSEQDKQAYMEALQQRLLTLLETGDLERAKALREGLLEFYSDRPDSTMAVAQLAISYATTGRVEDANALLRKAAAKVKGLNTKDMGALFEVVIKAAKGEYPPPQDFFAFSSDAMRLEAYVQLAVLYDRSGQTGYSRRVAADMARFAQKSSFKVEGSVVMRAFSKVLIETM
ncbi:MULTISPECIES: tetratricopeptide repeat protein [Pseudomonas]|nr:hypothetical protein [Pseudomonas putida]